MKVHIHGGGMEVGRSCFEIRTKSSRFLFDSGVRITEEGLIYPENFDLSKIDSVFLAHGHLDHCGALPMFHFRGLRSLVYCTKMTKTLATLMLKDSWNVARLKELEPIYTKENLKGSIGLLKGLDIGKKVKFSDGNFSMKDAGHIPGSSTFLVETNGKKIVYSGDLNLDETYLLSSTSPIDKDVDLLIIEATYGSRNHEPRVQEHKRFRAKVKETIDNGGKVIVPAFAIGRAQEMAMILFNTKVPIYMDGMAKKVATKLIHSEPSVKDQAFLGAVMKSVKYVKGMKDRMDVIAGDPCVIITTSGMVTGGPVMDYLKHLYGDPRNAICLVGYQGEGTNGRMLLESGRAFIDGMKIRVRCSVDKFNFSAHADQKSLIEYIKMTNPKKVILQHGDEENILALDKELKKEKINVYSPMNGDVIEF